MIISFTLIYILYVPGNGFSTDDQKYLLSALWCPIKRMAKKPATAVKSVVKMNFLDFNSFFINVVSSFHSSRCRLSGSLKFGVVVAGQFYTLGNSRVGMAEHIDIEFDVTGEDIFHPVASHMEGKADITDPVVIRGKRNLVCKAVCHHVFQHGGIIAAGIEGIQVFTEISLSLGAVSVCIDAGA